MYELKFNIMIILKHQVKFSDFITQILLYFSGAWNLSPGDSDVTTGGADGWFGRSGDRLSQGMRRQTDRGVAERHRRHIWATAPCATWGRDRQEGSVHDRSHVRYKKRRIQGQQISCSLVFDRLCLLRGRMDFKRVLIYIFLRPIHTGNLHLHTCSSWISPKWYKEFEVQ